MEGEVEEDESKTVAYKCTNKENEGKRLAQFGKKSVEAVDEPQPNLVTKKRRVEIISSNSDLEDNFDLIISKALDDEASSAEEKLANLVKLVGSREQDVMNRKLVIHSMEKWKSPSFANIRLLCFGSSASGLAFFNSDMDIYLGVPEPQNGLEIEDWDSWRDRKLQVLKKASKLIRAHPADVIQPVLVSKARVPVFKFIHSLTGISCDVTCMSSIGVHNCLLFRFIVDSDPRIRCLFFLVKLWAKRQRFQDLSSYGLCLLVLFYLQKRDSILPSIEY